MNKKLLTISALLITVVITTAAMSRSTEPKPATTEAQSETHEKPTEKSGHLEENDARW